MRRFEFGRARVRWFLASLAAAWLCTGAFVGAAHAVSVKGCRSTAASKASSLYKKESTEFAHCGDALAKGKPCVASLRDAKLQAALFNTQTALIAACHDPYAGLFGFASDDALAVSVAGAAAGEGRGVVDAVYGRAPGPLPATTQKCAKQIATQATGAAKKHISTLIKCGTACTATDTGKVDAAWSAAAARLAAKCSPGDLTTLVGSLPTYLTAARAGAQRVVSSLSGSTTPVVSFVAPVPSAILSPPSLPAPVGVQARVLNVGSPAYVTRLDVNGQQATLNPATGNFEVTLNVTPNKVLYPLVATARTTKGVVTSTNNVKFNLGSVAPSVQITSPASGTITPAGSVNVSGQVLGDLTKADQLTVGGLVTSFNPTTGAFSRSVPLTPDVVQIVDASVQSVALNTNNSDSVVVMRGTALGLGSPVAPAFFNRLNNSGFGAVTSLIQAELDPAFDPSNFIGTSAGGGTISEFSTGAKNAVIQAAGAHSVTLTLTIHNFHIKVDNVVVGCGVQYDASSVVLFVDADLQGQLQAQVNNTQVTFNGGSANIVGGFGCDVINTLNFIVDIEAMFESEFGSQIAAEFPAGINQALAGINVSGPIGQALDVNLDSTYESIDEDSTGVTFKVDANVTALSPIPDAPPITATLANAPVGPPVLGPLIPSTSTPYDMGFCLTDAFINRFMTAFMLQGMFNQSLSEFPTGPGTTIPLVTDFLSLIFSDDSFGTACPSCPVTLVLKPTAAPVARPPLPADNGDVTLVIPNYEMDIVADNNGTPFPMLSATVVFNLPLKLGASGSVIEPSVGNLSVTNVKIIDNPIGANETNVASQAVQLFPLAASALGDLFAAVPLPPFEGLTLNGRGDGYNVSCTGLYLGFGT